MRPAWVCATKPMSERGLLGAESEAGQAPIVRRHGNRPAVGHPIRLSARESRIHGYGLFADQNIPPQTFVIDYIGEKISNEQADRREVENDRKGVTYIFWLDDDCSIDGEFLGNDSRYVNHSCEPNCRVVRRNGRILLYSKRRIERGEELTIDYAYDWNSKKEICRCGSPECRGFINESQQTGPSLPRIGVVRETVQPTA